MADVEKAVDVNMASFSELAASLIEQLGKAFIELEAHEIASTNEVHWSDVEQHFRHLESTVKKIIKEVEAKEKELAERETHNHSILAEREAAVLAKEQDLIDRVQELKDAAVAAIAEAQENYKPESLDMASVGDTNRIKVSSSIENENENARGDAPEGKSPHKIGQNAEDESVEVDPRAELTQFCKQMDSSGLLKFISRKIKSLSDVCKEQLSVVFGSAIDPARLVLDALEGFFPPKETTEKENNQDAAIIGMRRSCLILMEALSAFLLKADTATTKFLRPENKQHAMSLANDLKPKLAEKSTDATNENSSLEAEAFLQLLATFRIASEFDEEELCKYVLAVAHHRQATELCRSLELTHKIPGLVETLIKSGRQIDAVHFIHAFQLSHTYPTVPLLKAYLKQLRRNCQGTGNATLQNDYNAQELAALKAVIECVERYNLQADYPLDPLHRRVAQLDKSVKGDKKRNSEPPVKLPEQKKPRPSGGFPRPRARGYGGGRRGSSSFNERVPSSVNERVPYSSGLVERYSSALPSPSPYSYPVSSQSSYAHPLASNEGVGSYYYAQDGRPRDLYSFASAAPAPAPAPTPSYGAYTQSSRYPYI